MWFNILRSTDGWSSARIVMDGRSHMNAKPNYKHPIPLRLAFTVLLFWLLCNKKLMVMILQFNNTSIHFMKDSPSQLSFLLAEFNSLWCEKSSSISPLMLEAFPNFLWYCGLLKKIDIWNSFLKFVDFSVIRAI